MHELAVTCISVNQSGRHQKACQSALPAEIWYQELLIMRNQDVVYKTCPHVFWLIFICYLDFLYRLAK